MLLGLLLINQLKVTDSNASFHHVALGGAGNSELSYLSKSETENNFFIIFDNRVMRQNGKILCKLKKFSFRD